MKIYTKTGDKGMTALLGGTRVPKSHIRIDAYGTIDELNAYIGLLRDQPVNEHRRVTLKEIQDRLFTIGALLATAPEKEKVKTPDLLLSDVEMLESAIDQMNEELPPLTSFVLPGGHASVSFCHIARCVCRRAERKVIYLNLHETVNEIAIQYLNRLSDYLFMLGRANSNELNIDEIVWNPRK